MAPTVPDLRAKFEQDVDWFNANNFSAGLANQYDRFHDGVAMKQIDDPGAYHAPKGAVRGYFNGKGTSDKARFEPDQTGFNASKPNSAQPNFHVIGDLGFVSGAADFIYSTIAPKPEARRIAYSFTYKYVDDEWKAIHLWGMYIP